MAVISQSDNNTPNVENPERKTMYLAPESVVPPEYEEPESEDGVGSWTFKPETTMHPYWAVRHVNKVELTIKNATAKLAKQKREAKGIPIPATRHQTINMTTACISAYVTVGGAVSRTTLLDRRKCTFRALTNSMNILMGDELLLSIRDVDDAPAAVDHTAPAEKRSKSSHPSSVPAAD